MSKAAELAALIGSQTAQSNRNLIINCAMQVFQRATSATAASNNFAPVDRFKTFKSNDGAYTSERSTDNPTGSGTSVKLQVTTADTSISAAQYAIFEQRIEAQNLQHLQYGTSSAKSLTASFWVKSNKTGQYSFSLGKNDSTTYIYAKMFTINSANTWEKKTITVSPTAGSTTLITNSGGAIVSDNGIGLIMGFSLALGSNFTGATDDSWSTNTSHYATTDQVNWMDSTDNNFYITQVQLEVGEVATPFEHLSFADDLALCQRYYSQSYVHGTAAGTSVNSFLQEKVEAQQFAFFKLFYPVAMRAAPTLTTFSTTGASGKLRNLSSSADIDETVAAYAEGALVHNSSAVTAGQNVAFHYTADAEL